MDMDSGGEPPDMSTNLIAKAYLDAMDAFPESSLDTDSSQADNPGLLECFNGAKRPNSSEPESSMSKKPYYISNSSVMDSISNHNNEKKTLYELNKNNRYNKNDHAPYFVVMESRANNIGKLHHMSLGKILFNSFKNVASNIKNISKLGLNKIKVETTNFQIANTILNASEFQHQNNLQAYIPESALFRKAVIHNIDPSLSEQEILSAIKSPIPIINVRRIIRRSTNSEGIVSQSNSFTVILTLRGQFLPDYVSIYGARCSVSPYIYRVTQCLKCLRFGHLARQCRSLSRCSNCGENHDSATCEIENPVCILCKGTHKATDPQCPEHNNKKLIKKYMAYNNVNFKEAKNKYKNFSEVTAYETAYKPNNFPPLPINNKYQALEEQYTSENLPMNYHTPDLRNPYRMNFNNRNRTSNFQINSNPSPQSATPTSAHSHPQRNQPSTNRPISNPYPPQYHLQANSNVPSSQVETNNLIKILSSILMQLINGCPPNPLEIASLMSALNTNHNG